MTRWVRRLFNGFRTERLERELDAELRVHLQLDIDRNQRAGMPPAEARRAAFARLGGVEQVKERVREARPFRWLSTTWLDVKLGLRMLRKSWGLTLVGGLAMTVVIGIAAFTFSFIQTTFGSTVPLDEGDRVVALMAWDAQTQRRSSPSRFDFERWRDTLRSVEDVGAFQTIERTLVTADGPADEPVSIAEMTASGFQLARVPPLLGRPLVEQDERDDATPVVVIGFDVWQSRFSADLAVVGRRLRLGGTVHTVVGVMPEGFAFPVSHDFWIPLRTDPSAYVRDEAPAVFVFARLAPGVTMEGAEAELTTVGLLPPVVVSETTERLQPRVVPYTLGLTSSGDGEQLWMRGLILLLVTLLLVPPCANIAVLVYARTVTRQEEFAARYALGASRGRIVGQLFVEVLVLSAGAAGVALVLLRLFLWLEPFRGPNDPFWMDYGDVSFATVLFAAALAVLAATIAGVVPALQATGRLVQSGLRALGSRTGMQLGRTWTALVVAQVAFAVAVLPSVVEFAWGTLRPGILGPGFAAEEFLTAQLAMDKETPPSAAAEAAQPSLADRFGDRQAELVRRLEAEPGVSAVTLSATVPGREPWAPIEVDWVDKTPAPASVASDRSSYVMARFNRVDDVFFDVFDVPLLTGRRFDRGDLEPAPSAVIVNRTFAQYIAGNENPLGHRVRYLSNVDRRRRRSPGMRSLGSWMTSPRTRTCLGCIIPWHLDRYFR